MFTRILSRIRKSPKKGSFNSYDIEQMREAAMAEKTAFLESVPLEDTLAELDALAEEIQHEVEAQPPPVELCGITSEMTHDEIRSRLAVLYRRYNRTASSLDAKLREEAEIMLDAIVSVREGIAVRP